MTKKSFILSGFILAKLLLQYNLINPYYDLHRDEYLHLDLANHLAWGYLSVPPVTSWISCVIQFLGNSVFWVKFFPALFGALTMVVVWETIKELKGNLFALVLGATCTLFSVLLRLNFLFQPNSLDVLSWTFCYYALIKYFNTEKTKWLFIAAIGFAIGFLNKYNIVFLIIGLLPAVLLTEQRKVFTRKELYISVLLCFLLMLPNLLWQYNNNFPVFHHLRELADTQLKNINRWDFFKDQIFYFVGSQPVIIASLYALVFYEPFKKFRFFFWTFLLTLAFFAYLRSKSYYAIGLYPIYISFGSVFIGNMTATSGKKYLQPVFIVIPVLFYVLLFKVVYSIQTPHKIFESENNYRKLGLLRWEDGKDHALPQDFADMLGWKELAAKVDTAFNKCKSGHTLILCDNYGQAGAINYYSRNDKIKAVTFHADYINWFDLDTNIDNLIRVKELKESQEEMQVTKPFFDTGFIADSIANPLAREYRTIIFVFSKPKIDINRRLRTEIEDEKNYR